MIRDGSAQKFYCGSMTDPDSTHRKRELPGVYPGVIHMQHKGLRYSGALRQLLMAFTHPKEALLMG